VISTALPAFFTVTVVELDVNSSGTIATPSAMSIASPISLIFH